MLVVTHSLACFPLVFPPLISLPFPDNSMDPLLVVLAHTVVSKVGFKFDPRTRA